MVDKASREWDETTEELVGMIRELPASCPKCGEHVSQWTHKPVPQPTGGPVLCTTNLVVPENQTPEKL